MNIGQIYINGIIGTFLDEKGNVTETGVELIDVIMSVKAQPQAEMFNVFINSPGGVVETGYEIYDYLKTLGKPINTIGFGIVGSIATVIFAAGSKRTLKPNTDLFFHLPGGQVSGNSDDIQFYAAKIKDAEKRVLKTYENDFGLSESEILPLLRKETTMDVETAFKLGITTEQAVQSEPVAYFNSKNKTMSKNETSTLSKIWNILKGANITNKVVFDAENKELDFYELEDGATIEVGAKANYDGKQADGEILVPSEENPDIVLTYVFKLGVLDEIKEPEEVVVEEDVVDEEMTALIAENEALKLQVAEITALKEENKSYKKAITAIKALETSHVPATATKQKQSNEPKAKENLFAQGITNLKNRK